MDMVTTAPMIRTAGHQNSGPGSLEAGAFQNGGLRRKWRGRGGGGLSNLGV